MSDDLRGNGRGTGDSAQQAGSASRFEQRWRLVGAGLSNVWRFGDLELQAPSGRLLLRGPNGTGKTTALEALAPYLFDLNAARMSAGKARTTNLSSLMREGASSRRRYGYAWLTLVEPQQGVWSFGVRIQYSDGAAPPAKVVPFGVRGRPLHELKVHGIGRAPLTMEQFEEAVAACGGELFDGEDAYVSHLAARLFGIPDRATVGTLASRLRQVRNPAMLGDVSPEAAAAALRESLPSVDEDVIAATADTLAESDATRDAFARDQEAAQLLDDFSAVWRAHVTEVVTSALDAATKAEQEVRAQSSKTKTCANELDGATTAAAGAKQRAQEIEALLSEARSEIDAIERHKDYADAGRLSELKKAASAQMQAADSAAQTMNTNAQRSVVESESLQQALRNIAEDLEELRGHARAADPTADGSAPLLSWTFRARASLSAGSVVANCGPEVAIHGDSAALRNASASWLRLAQGHQERSEAAALAIADYKHVEKLEQEAHAKARVARERAAAADAESAKAKRAEADAQGSASRLLGAMELWTHTNPQLTEAHVPASDAELTGVARGSPWCTDDVKQLADAEPPAVLATCDAWARHATSRAEAIAGELRANAKQSTSEAAKLREEALRLRKEAAELRSGRLLPLPRPDWAPLADDSIALGAALEDRVPSSGVRVVISVLVGTRAQLTTADSRAG